MIAWVLLLAIAPAASAQRRSALDFPADYIVHITERWGRGDRRLGDLRLKPLGRDDIELRFWGGYGLVGTRGVSLSRTNGRWSVSRIAVRRCGVALPRSIADTLSEASQDRYLAEGRRRCGALSGDTLSNDARVLASDTLDAVPAMVPADLDRVWNELLESGIRTLPTSVQRDAMMLDGHTYVVQLRVGPEYRVSRIEHWHRLETAADTAVQRINAIITERIGWD